MTPILILTLKPGQTVFIGPDIKVTLTKLQPSQVKIGVQATPDVAIDREEVRERKDAERDQQATS